MLTEADIFLIHFTLFRSKLVTVYIYSYYIQVADKLMEAPHFVIIIFLTFLSFLLGLILNNNVLIL